MEPNRINIKGANSTIYPYVIGEGLLEDHLPAFINAERYSRVVIISNPTVAQHYAQKLMGTIENSLLLTIPDGEAYKTLATVQTVYDELITHDIQRDAVIVALGGGVIGDLAGHVAATYLRGIDFVQVPTTILAMVDASIGGKVGVDLPQGKNLIGAFKDPRAIFADTQTLSTLPPEEIKSGLAEVIKAAIIGDANLFDQLEANLTPPHTEIIQHAAQLKIKIVENDREEHGQRALLNLGHTFGHAIEQVSGYKIRHGEGVAIGLVAAADLSVRLGYLNSDVATRIKNTLIIHQLPVTYANTTPDTLYEAMKHDKKRADNQIRFILIRDIGDCFITAEVPKHTLFETLEKICHVS